MVKLHAFLLALIFATSSVLALPVGGVGRSSQIQPRGLEEPFKREVIEEYVTLDVRTSNRRTLPKAADAKPSFFNKILKALSGSSKSAPSDQDGSDATPGEHSASHLDGSDGGPSTSAPPKNSKKSKASHPRPAGIPGKSPKFQTS